MKKTTNSSPYQFEGRIPLSQAIPLGLQHVMAMFIGNLTPLIIVMGACGLTADAGFAELRTALLQNAMIIAGIVTLVQMFSIGPVGGKVPIVMGTSSGFLGVLNNTVAACGGGVIAYGAIMGACIVGGIFEGILGAFLKPLRRFFPAIVTGSVVIAIGLSLLGVAALFFSTLKRPKNIPSIQAKNRPHSASSKVCPIARSSRFPYLVIIWIMEISFQKQSCHKMQQPCNSCSVLSQSEF